MAFLLSLAGIKADIDSLLVRPMNDGGMGSLAFNTVKSGARFGSEVAECHFEDVDGVPVLAALYVDEEGSLFELDMWKVDFSPLKRWPADADLKEGGTVPGN